MMELGGYAFLARVTQRSLGEVKRIARRIESLQYQGLTPEWLRTRLCFELNQLR